LEFQDVRVKVSLGKLAGRTGSKGNKGGKEVKENVADHA
jgi:hypothetical protein